MLKQNNATPLHRLVTRQCLLFCLFLIFSLFVHAQFTVTFQLKTLPYSHRNDSIFVAGNFNEWNPSHKNSKFIKNEKGYFLKLSGLAAGTYQFKFTRGGWDKVECDATGADVLNHSIFLTRDIDLEFDIVGWKDDFTMAPKQHTASANVHIIDTAFEIPQLKRRRRTWIYLPPGYKNSDQYYPVLYMQDGQNLFDDLTSGYGEWGVDECLDTLVNKSKPGCIIIGIDNGGEKRMNEYNPFEFTWKDSSSSQIFEPEGDAYLDFIIHTLKPYIDQHYRTLPAKENTIIAGSSMGGLISYYAVLKYPEVFGKAGIFSPAFWTADGIDALTDSLASTLKGKYFFYIGGKEGQRHIDNMVRIQEKLGKNSAAMIYSFIDPEAKHNEQAWRKWFVEFYLWIMADGFNVITGGEN